MDLILRFENSDKISCKLLLYKGPRSRGIGKPVLNSRSVLSNVKYGDVFCYKVYAEGYYTYKKAFIINESDIQKGEKWIKLSFDKRKNNGYEAESVNYWTEEVEKKLVSGEYELKNVLKLDTPAFSEEKAMHEFTTTDECIQYLKEICEGNPNATLFYLDDMKQIPVVVISDSIAKETDLWKTIDTLKKNSRLKVMYQAQIHGNEPAAGEAALTAVKILSQDTELLKKADIVVVPHVNPYGSEKFVRFSDKNKMNLNRDSLILESETTKKLRKIYLGLMPEVFIDAHEFCAPFNGMFDEEEGNYLKMNDDIQVTCLNNLNRDQEIYRNEKKIIEYTLENLENKGFRCFCYRPTCDYSTSCGYTRSMSSFIFFIETNGIGRGKLHFERRVISQIEAIKLLISQVAQKSEEIKVLVEKARGEHPSEFVLKHEVSEEDVIWIRRPSFDFFGNVIGDQDKKEPYYNLDKAVKAMPYPKAYILDKSDKFTERIKGILKDNGAVFEELLPDSKIRAAKYKEWLGKKYWTREKEIKLKNGAYLFDLNQIASNVIIASLEPEVEDMTKGNGIARPADLLLQCGKKYPVYRVN